MIQMEQEHLRFNPPSQNINGKRFVIPDIHGCFYTFERLLNKIELTKSDHLFLLGDYFDRGQYGNKVIDLILHLLHEGYLIFPLKGNHEQMLLDSERRKQSGTDAEIPRLHKHKDLSDIDGNIRIKYLDFIKSLPYYFELDHYFLVHAGFNFNCDHPFEDFFSMVWIKDFEINPDLVGNKKIIHGHCAQDLSIIRERIEKRSQIIPLDNGCYSKSYKQRGNLLCLELGNLALFIQENIEDIEK